MYNVYFWAKTNYGRRTAAILTVESFKEKTNGNYALYLQGKKIATIKRKDLITFEFIMEE